MSKLTRLAMCALYLTQFMEGLYIAPLARLFDLPINPTDACRLRASGVFLLFDCCGIRVEVSFVLLLDFLISAVPFV